MILRAAAVVTMDGAPLIDSAVRVEGDRIIAVAPASELPPENDEPVLELGEMILLPGLINAHCHLDYTMMRHAIDPPKSFTAWVQRINALKRSLDDSDYLATIALGFAELKRWGTTTVCNIEAFPELMPQLPPSPIRTWWFYEMIDIRHRLTTEDVVAGALGFFQTRRDSLDSFGLNPHAPYTASRGLYHLANTCAARFRMLLTTHVAESREEFAMFRSASGPLYDFMKALQRPMEDCGAETPFRQLWLSGAIHASWILAHMNELAEADFALLEELPRGAGPHLVHCPHSHRYFAHAPFPLQRLRALGLNISVGTDSLASAESLSLLGELRLLRMREPALTAEELLQMVTRNPAQALQRGDDLGRLAPGALADLIALPIASSLGDLYEKIIAFARPIPWMMIDGKIVS